MPEMQERKGEATDYLFSDKDFKKELIMRMTFKGGTGK